MLFISDSIYKKSFVQVMFLATTRSSACHYLCPFGPKLITANIIQLNQSVCLNILCCVWPTNWLPFGLLIFGSVRSSGSHNVCPPWRSLKHFVLFYQRISLRFEQCKAWGGSFENCVRPAGVFSHAHFGYQHHHYMQIMVSIREIGTLSILWGWSLYKIPKRDSISPFRDYGLSIKCCFVSNLLCSLIIIFVYLDQSKRERGKEIPIIKFANFISIL